MQNPVKFVSARLCLATLLLFAFTGNSGCSSPPTPEEAKAEKKEKTDFRKRWEDAAAILRKSKNTVEPYSEDAPHTLRVLLVQEVTQHDARKLAISIRKVLGEEGIVYIYDDTRKQLAKASSWGTE